MPKIEIITPAVAVDQPFPGYGTRLLMDGREIPEVRSIDLRVAVDEAVRVTAEVLATESFHFEGQADLHIYVTPTPDMEITEEVRDDGVKVYRCRPVGSPA